MAAAGLKNFGIVPFGKLTMGLRRGEKLSPMLKPSTSKLFNQLMILLQSLLVLGHFQKTNSFLQKDVLR